VTGPAALAAGLFGAGALTASLAWLLGWPSVGFAGRWLLIAGLVLWAWRRRTLTSWILVSMLVGAWVGYDWPETGMAARLLSQIFIRMIKTIIAPLLFATLVVGIAGHPNLRHVGRMGVKALVYFEAVTTLALFIGLAAINLSQAGVGIEAPAAHVEQGASDRTHHVVEEAVGLARIEQRQDVRMLEARGGGDLLHEPLGAQDRRELRPQDLERHVPLVFEVLGEVDGGHPAFTEMALDAIAVGEGR